VLIGLDVWQDIVLRLAIALCFGALIGLERSYHGRPEWFKPSSGPIRAAIDPTRMAQGIMTGIGFLGAGVIMKDGLSVRGLTTAASIWITAGIGILVGIGFFLPAGLTTALTLGALGGFRWIERRMKTESYAHFSVRFVAGRAATQAELLEFVSGNGFATADVTHWFRQSEGMEYRMVVHSLDADAVTRLSGALRQRDDVAEFRISPTGD
jgi:putative Mg2+ transporter-C (MgtC) family protein